MTLHPSETPPATITLKKTPHARELRPETWTH